jgi:hypothetical protein
VHRRTQEEYAPSRFRTSMRPRTRSGAAAAGCPTGFVNGGQRFVHARRAATLPAEFHFNAGHDRYDTKRSSTAACAAEIRVEAQEFSEAHHNAAAASQRDPGLTAYQVDVTESRPDAATPQPQPVAVDGGSAAGTTRSDGADSRSPLRMWCCGAHKPAPVARCARQHTSASARKRAPTAPKKPRPKW